MTSSSYLLERAWVDGAVHDDVLVEIEDGRFTSVTLPGQSLHSAGVATAANSWNRRLTGDSDRVPGLTIPGMANCHSHAFHRALRGRTQRERGTFWTWREQMYAVAATLDPDSYFALARATFREMAAAGITGVGEFHYLHHQPDGTAYDDPNAMGHALIEAAREAGIRIALLEAEQPSLPYRDVMAEAMRARGVQLPDANGTMKACIIPDTKNALRRIRYGAGWLCTSQSRVTMMTGQCPQM